MLFEFNRPTKFLPNGTLPTILCRRTQTLLLNLLLHFVKSPLCSFFINIDWKRITCATIKKIWNIMRCLMQIYENSFFHISSPNLKYWHEEIMHIFIIGTLWLGTCYFCLFSLSYFSPIHLLIFIFPLLFWDCLGKFLPASPNMLDSIMARIRCFGG